MTKMRARFLAVILCAELTVLGAPLVNGQNTLGANAVTTADKVGIWAGIAAAAGMVVLVTYLVVRKPSITGCVENGANGPSLRTAETNKIYSLTGNMGQLKAGERVRVSGKANRREHAFAVRKIAKDLGACPIGSS